LLEELNDSPSRQQVRTAFMLCHLIPLLNRALLSYRRDVCYS
jgi:hypothetical protein